MLTVATPTFAVFWETTRCSLIGIYWRFRGLFCLHYDRKWSLVTLTPYCTTSRPKWLVFTQIFSSQSVIICFGYFSPLYQMLVLFNFIDYVLSCFFCCDSWSFVLCTVFIGLLAVVLKNKSLLYLIHYLITQLILG